MRWTLNWDLPGAYLLPFTAQGMPELQGLPMIPASSKGIAVLG